MRLRCLLVLAALLWGAAPAPAHELRPALLQVTETGAGTYEVLWKRPQRGELTLGLRVAWPEGAMSWRRRRRRSSPAPWSSDVCSPATAWGSWAGGSRSTASPAAPPTCWCGSSFWTGGSRPACSSRPRPSSRCRDHVPLAHTLRGWPGAIEVATRSAIYTSVVLLVLVIEKAFEARAEQGGLMPALANILQHSDLPNLVATTMNDGKRGVSQEGETDGDRDIGGQRMRGLFRGAAAADLLQVYRASRPVPTACRGSRASCASPGA